MITILRVRDAFTFLGATTELAFIGEKPHCQNP